MRRRRATAWLSSIATFAAAHALGFATPARAWLFPEHDRIAADAIARLPASSKAILASAWQLGFVDAAPAGDVRARWCKDVGAGISPRTVVDDAHWCVGFSTLSAFAGDHACTPQSVADTVEQQAWPGPLLVNARDLAARMATPGITAAERIDAWRAHNLALQEIDRSYVARAQTNAAHFLRPLEGTVALDAYLAASLAAGGEQNAIAAYAHSHLRALAAASRAASHCTKSEHDFRCGPGAGSDVREALLDEAFADHFLEDSFSAGHIVGSWGDVGQRLGTHDHYSEHGLDVRTWSGEQYAAHGDAFLAADDEARASEAVLASLAQLIDALTEGVGDEAGARDAGERGDGDAPVSSNVDASDAADPALASPLDACRADVKVPPGLASAGRMALLDDVVKLEPVPSSRATGVPRFRSEVGPFVGISVDANGLTLFDTHGLALSDARLRLGVGTGFALEGAFSQFMDGEMFVDGMILMSMHEYSIARRGVGFGVRARMPFVFLPGDLLYVVGPVAIFDPQLAYQLAKQAVAGGAAQIESQLILRETLSCQLVLGREISASWVPDVGFTFEVPVVQLSGDRLFTGAFSTSTVLQLGGAFHWNYYSGETFAGLVVEVAERGRRYIPQD